MFEASQVTTSGYSLNSILAKGINIMNKLIEILICWSTHRFDFHTDMTKCHHNLSVADDSYVTVFKTLIYGVKSSSNQAESGLRTTARIERGNFPKSSTLIQKDIYMLMIAYLGRIPGI